MNPTRADEPMLVPNDAPELQQVLTRYVDSRDGYQQAAESAHDPAFAEAFETIARRRSGIALRLVEEIRDQGLRPDLRGSTEAKIHRWWLNFRADAASDDLHATLSECLRGERELERTIQSALKDAHLLPEHRPLLEAAREDLTATVAELDRLAAS